MKIFPHLCFQLLVISSCLASSLAPNFSESDAEAILPHIQKKYNLYYGSFNEEVPEQIMSVMFISPQDRVLELGGNIGRNSCIISTILSGSQNLVVAESDPRIAGQLMQNRNHNHLHFQIEASAISQKPLIQAGWVTVPSETVPEGHVQVNVITYQDLKAKYGLKFSVIVADCEGALFYIFQDDESMLDDVDLLILENDYCNRVHYEEVRDKIIAHGFHLAYNKAGGWGPCYNEFYQVWKKL